MADFWKRWHISLSTWLRDYLFIPIGGSRCGKWRGELNIFITMALGGLWHGASWNFVIWGIYHGLCLIAHKEFTQVKAMLPNFDRFWNSKLFNLLSIFTTFNAVAVGCVFFGMTNINLAFTMIKRMLLLHPIFSTAAGVQQFLVLRQELPLIVPITVSLAVALLILNYPLSRMIERNMFAPVPVPVKAVYWSGLVVLLVMFSSNVAQPFIYFQF
jgi:D-alanyl-lipoteichoic acid acyltransferase DltB (MBOAT superfamily)